MIDIDMVKTRRGMLRVRRTAVYRISSNRSRALNTSRASNTGRGSDSDIVLIEAGGFYSMKYGS